MTYMLWLGLLLVGSAFFSGAETALFSLTREQAALLRRHGRSTSPLLAVLGENPAGLLAAILFGNLVVNVLFFCMTTALTHTANLQYGPGRQAVQGLSALVALILFGEILPKAVGISFPDRVVRMTSAPLRGWYLLIGPIRAVLEKITSRMTPPGSPPHRLDPGELKMLIEATQDDQSFGRHEKAVVEDIVNLPEVRVRDLMVPRAEQTLWNGEVPVAEALEQAATQGIDLLLVYLHEEGQTIGYAELGELFACRTPEKPLRHLVHPVECVPENKRADQMLRDFLSSDLRLVGVMNECGELAGTIVIENLFEEVISEYDTHEASPVEQLGETTYRLEGRLDISAWQALFVGVFPEEVIQHLALDTISGLVVSLLKRMPKAGDVAEMGNLRFTIEKVHSNHIETVLLELTANREEP